MSNSERYSELEELCNKKAYPTKSKQVQLQETQSLWRKEIFTVAAMESSLPETRRNLGLSLQSHFQGVHFMRATLKDRSTLHQEPGTGLQETGSNGITGLEARTFYESVISQESSAGSAREVRCSDSQEKKINKTKPAKSTSCQRQSERVLKRNSNMFLSSAQEGDLKSLQRLLEGGVDVNAVDDFNWTALMCASYSGHVDAVAFLLEQGALWECHRDNSGRTALDLAKMSGHTWIIQMLHASKLPSAQLHHQATTATERKFWCELCQMEISGSSERQHQSSTVHIFNANHKPQSTLYYIPESNVGFQMMMKEGWDKEKGLGPDGSGLKFPVKTVLKRDRKGLGAAGNDKTSKARITHFKPFDVEAVKKPTQPKEKRMRATTLDKRARKISEKRHRNWERNFRQSFHLDF